MTELRRVVSLRPRINRDWSAQELAELYRVGDILRQVGWSIETDSGYTDEGDPWFVYCDEATGSVVAHFAKINGNFVLASSVLKGSIEGTTFSSIVGRFLAQYPVIVSPSKANGSTLVFAHPVAALGAIVATLAAAQAIDHADAAADADAAPIEQTGLARAAAALAEFSANSQRYIARFVEKLEANSWTMDGVIVAMAAVAVMRSLSQMDVSDEPANVELSTALVGKAQTGPSAAYDAEHHAIAAAPEGSEPWSTDRTQDGAGFDLRASKASIHATVDDGASEHPQVLGIDGPRQAEDGTFADLVGWNLQEQLADAGQNRSMATPEFLWGPASAGGENWPGADQIGAVRTSSDPTAATSPQAPWKIALPQEFVTAFGTADRWQGAVTVVAPTDQAVQDLMVLEAKAAPVAAARTAAEPGSAATGFPVTTNDTEFDLLLSFLEAAGPVMLLVAQDAMYLVDRDAIGASTEIMSMDIALPSGVTVHLIGLADVFADLQSA